MKGRDGVRIQHRYGDACCLRLPGALAVRPWLRARWTMFTSGVDVRLIVMKPMQSTLPLEIADQSPWMRSVISSIELVRFLLNDSNNGSSLVKRRRASPRLSGCCIGTCRLEPRLTSADPRHSFGTLVRWRMAPQRIEGKCSPTGYLTKPTLIKQKARKFAL
jgi:hypothetical protein